MRLDVRRQDDEGLVRWERLVRVVGESGGGERWKCVHGAGPSVFGRLKVRDPLTDCATQAGVSGWSNREEVAAASNEVRGRWWCCALMGIVCFLQVVVVKVVLVLAGC